MGARELKHQAMVAEWAEKIKACRSSGQAVKKWCKEHGIASSTYYTWEREVLETAGKALAEETTGIIALPMERETENKGIAARIEAGGVTVEIEKGADAETIRAIIEAVRGC